jgi:tRNA nucleotidyltransferase/poly(A) polymerase
MKYTLYEVGGAIRDRLLGIENPKDIDYSVVIEDK